MMQKHRISTNIGEDQKVTVELKQDYDLLEILSLKFTQQDVYTSLCADYGVVCGRISANKGFGVPNVRVSIFVPLTDEDSNDPVVSALYPYTDTTGVNAEGYKYNLLPSRRQHGGHEPTGTFPDQSDILGREEVLEVFEKYYKYTVKTNESGDFMIWGVPLGQQILHVNVDLSDIGCFSLRPDDFIGLGAGVDQFQNTYKYKSSSDFNSLPQILTFEKTIEVFPFWGNVELCELGITRTDFDLSEQGVTIQPKAYIIGGTYSDTGKNSINKNCMPRKKMGRKCMMTSEKGTIETIRFTPQKDTSNRPILEELDLNEDIDESGSFMMSVDMNMDYLITNEFGENEYSNDPNKGIPTSAVHRFRIGIKNEMLGRKRVTANYLIPNIKEHTNDTDKSYAWSTDYNDYPTDGQSDILNNIDGLWYPQDYFYRFTYNKVYTVSSFQSSYSPTPVTAKEKFLGIKEISPAEEEDCDGEVNTFPINFGLKNYTFTLLIADILLTLEFILNIVKLGFLNTLSRTIIQFGCDIDFRPLREVAQKFKLYGFKMEESGQKLLHLIVYPECDECTGNEETLGNIGTNSTSQLPPYCTAGTVHLDNPTYSVGGTYPLSGFTYVPSSVGDCASCADPLLDITTESQSSIYYNSGYTPTAFLMQNLEYYVLTNTTTATPMGTGLVQGTPVYHKSYTYNFSPYFNDPTGNTLSIVYDGTSYPITIPTYPYTETNLKTAIQSGLSSVTSFGPAGATVEVFLGGDFEISPNSAKLFGNATVIDGGGSHTLTPSIFTSTIIIDYINITYEDRDGYFSSPLPPYNGPSSVGTGFTLNISYVFTDKVFSGRSTCFEYTIQPPITLPIESGCEIYDVPYNEDIISYYFTSTGSTINTTVPDDRAGTVTYTPGMNIVATMVSEIGSGGACTSSKKSTPDLYYEDTPNGRIFPLPTEWAESGLFDRKTKSGKSEFRNGVFYFVPGTMSNGRLFAMLREWRKRKRVAKMFCGGIVNYSFIDNWLSGSLYFFAFKAKNKRRNNTKHCSTLVKWVTGQSKFYYRSTSYNQATNNWGIESFPLLNNNLNLNRPTTFVDLGPRDEFIKEICTDAGLDPNCSISRKIGPTSFKSFGEIQGLNINYRLDVTDDSYTLDSFFGNTGFGNFYKAFNGDVLQLISINSEVGIEEFDLQNPKYLGYSYQVLDPEGFPDVFSTDNGVAGVYVDGTTGKPNGPLPVTFDLDEDGERVRACLNEPTHLDYSGNVVQGRLTESSQPVPFFLWEKNGRGFGDNTNNQHWDYTAVEVQPLQGMTYGYSLNSAPNDSSDPYLLLPMTYTYGGLIITAATGNATNELPYDVVVLSPDPDTHTLYDNEYPGFSYLYVTSGTSSGGEIIAYSGTSYVRYGTAGQWSATPWNYLNDFMIRRTEDYYSGTKQILSTPFMFYFGLRPGNTGLDKFIERFGPTGAFPEAE